jgi:hypothetical protein
MLISYQPPEPPVHWADAVGRQAAGQWAAQHPSEARKAEAQAERNRRAVAVGQLPKESPHPWELLWVPGDEEAEWEALLGALDGKLRFQHFTGDLQAMVRSLQDTIEEIEQGIEFLDLDEPPRPWWRRWWKWGTKQGGKWSD